MKDLRLLVLVGSRNATALPESVREIVNFLSTWGWALAEYPNLDKWWRAAPVFSRLQLRPCKNEWSIFDGRVLTPHTASGAVGYRAACSKEPSFNGSECKLTGGDRRFACQTDFDEYRAVAFKSGRIEISQLV